MYDVIDMVLKRLLESSEQASLSPVKYLGFKGDDDIDWVDGVNAGLMFGRVQYIHTNTAHQDVEEAGSPHQWMPMVLKLTPQVISFPQFHAFAFINEAHFYTRLVPFFHRMSPDIRSLFPKMYTSYFEMGEFDDKYMLVFENLKEYGYKPSKMKSFLDIHHLKLMLRTLGKFHAFSYEAKRSDGDQFQALGSLINEIHFSVTKKMPLSIPALALRGYQPLKEDPKYASKLDGITKAIPNANVFLSDIFCGEKNLPMSGICHGDFLQSNVLFKYDGNSSEVNPTDLKIVDVASIKVGSPILDLALVMYLNTDQVMRTNHWDELINSYYNSMYDTFPSSVPTKEDILNEFKNKALYAYFIASYFLPQTISSDLNLPSLNECLPSEYKGFNYSDVPEPVLIDGNMKMGGEKATNSLTEILKDMIDRNFI